MHSICRHLHFHIDPNRVTGYVVIFLSKKVDFTAPEKASIRSKDPDAWNVRKISNHILLARLLEHGFSREIFTEGGLRSRMVNGFKNL